MTPKELKQIKDRLECPACHSRNISIFFLDRNKNEVDYSIVNKVQKLSDYEHYCTCNKCGYDMDRTPFDYEENNKWVACYEAFTRMRLPKMSLAELDFSEN